MEPTHRSVPVAVLRADLASLLNATQWQGETIEITRHNKPAAYLVGPEWFERASRALAHDPRPVHTTRDVHNDVHREHDVQEDDTPLPTADPKQAAHGYYVDRHGRLCKTEE